MKAIIFDFDGVICDSFEISYKISKEFFGDDFTEENLRELLDGNVFQNPKITKQAAEKLFKAYNEKLKYFEMEKVVKESLEKLAEKYSLFVISSNQEESIKTYFQNNNCTHIFKEILGAETHQSKVAKFQHLFEKYQLKAEDCVFVTDTLGDILEGKEVGVEVIAVDFGFHGRDRLEKGEPFKIVSSFDEISEVIVGI